LRFVLARQLFGDLKRRRLDVAASDFGLWLAIKSGRTADPNDTFDLLMTISEAAGVSSTFNFITRWTNPVYDMNYVFDSPTTRALLTRIAARGHTIGLHGSYNAHRSARQLSHELHALQRVCGATGIQQEEWSSRQHYLRWRTPNSFQNCEDVGLSYDSTLGHADAVGFRCGTSHEFPAFNLATAKELRLRERPLIAMDCTVMDADFHNLGAGAAAFDCLKSLKDTCRHYGGDFTLLWHNNRVVKPAEIALYKAIVAA
jgi:peptidoglycan/xylan/chitin deacetylase (PgdA/CDA1 family)